MGYGTLLNEENAIPAAARIPCPEPVEGPVLSNAEGPVPSLSHSAIPVTVATPFR